MRPLTDIEIIACRNSAGQFQPKRVSVELRERICGLTAFLPETVSLKQRFYSAVEGVGQWPTCMGCSKLTAWDNFKNIYREYCSVHCANGAFRGTLGKQRAASRSKFRQIDAGSIEELLRGVTRSDGFLNGNVTNDRHLTKRAIALLNEKYPGDEPLRSKLILLHGGVEVFPTCRGCGSGITIETSSDLLRNFCGTVCSNNDEEKISQVRDLWVARSGVTSNLVEGVISPETQRLLETGEVGRLYRDEKLNGARIAERLGISTSTACIYLNRWAAENGVELSGNRSLLEKKIEDMLRIHDVTFSHSRRDIISPLEIDIWIDDLALGIEVHGDYWHSDEYKSSGYHVEKADLADKANIKLYQFFEHEINNSPEIVESMIVSQFLNYRIAARKCTIGEIDNAQYRRFLDGNHIQGWAPAKVRLGLFHNGDLVSVASWGKPRFNSNFDYELIRFCSSRNMVVVGGFSRLLTRFRREYPGSILTYADRRFSSQHSNVYEKTGFELLERTRPSYFYIGGGGKLVSRYMAQKHKLPKLLGGCYDDTLSERQNMKQAKYFRIWDAGQLVYGLKG